MFALRRSTRSLASSVRGFAGVNLTKIVATIGPVSEDAVMLPKLVQNGMAVMRVNFSHATEEEVELRLKSLAGSAGYFPLDAKGHKLRAVLLDTKGKAVRGSVLGFPWRLPSPSSTV
jgi:pyruvate kinase